MSLNAFVPFSKWDVWIPILKTHIALLSCLDNHLIAPPPCALWIHLSAFFSQLLRRALDKLISALSFLHKWLSTKQMVLSLTTPCLLHLSLWVCVLQFSDRGCCMPNSLFLFFITEDSRLATGRCSPGHKDDNTLKLKEACEWTKTHQEFSPSTKAWWQLTVCWHWKILRL